MYHRLFGGDLYLGGVSSLTITLLVYQTVLGMSNSFVEFFKLGR